MDARTLFKIGDRLTLWIYPSFANCGGPSTNDGATVTKVTRCFVTYKKDEGSPGYGETMRGKVSVGYNDHIQVGTRGSYQWYRKTEWDRFVFSVLLNDYCYYRPVCFVISVPEMLAQESNQGGRSWDDAFQIWWLRIDLVTEVKCSPRS